MIEIQIESKELYDKLKQYSNYNSDLTKVCSFRDELSDLLKDNGLLFEEKEKNNDQIPILDITGRNVMELKNAPAEMLYFVGVKSEFDPTIPIRFMNEVRLLIKANLVQRTEKFNKLYSKLGYRNKINELLSANVKFYSKGKLTDFIDPGLTIQSLKFNECTEKLLIYRQMKVKVLGPIIKKDKYDEFIGETGGSKIIIRFYNKSLILKSIAFKGNSIFISSNKITVNDNEEYVVYDPMIVPKGLEFTKDIMYTPPKRNIPIDLYRNALYEFMYRYEIE